MTVGVQRTEQCQAGGEEARSLRRVTSNENKADFSDLFLTPGAFIIQQVT